MKVIDEAVVEDVRRRLDHVETIENVRILLAVESGSRAWGFPSKDSDYDVRFVYIHPPEWYLSVDTDFRRDVIERPIIDEIDLSGWEIRKALLLFAKSNPPLLEWLASPLVYKDTQTLAPRLRDLLPGYYAPNASLYHYLHMAQGNFKDYLRGDVVWVKKYFYVLRPLLAVRWIEQGRGPVPMLFTDVLATITDNPALVSTIENLRSRKMAGEELDRGPAIPVITEFVSSELSRLEQLHPERKVQYPGFKPLNELFRSVLSETFANRSSCDGS
jgi:predicted nucleotidyltransferase